jgi:hypothetical protein
MKNTERPTDDFLHDVLDVDADTLRAASLAKMLDAGRQAQSTRRHIRQAVWLTLLCSVGIAAWLVPQHRQTDGMAKSAPARAMQIRQLTDEELSQRLNRFAVAWAGETPHRRVVLIEPTTSRDQRW